MLDFLLEINTADVTTWAIESVVLQMCWFFCFRCKIILPHLKIDFEKYKKPHIIEDEI